MNIVHSATTALVWKGTQEKTFHIQLWWDPTAALYITTGTNPALHVLWAAKQKTQTYILSAIQAHRQNTSTSLQKQPNLKKSTLDSLRRSACTHTWSWQLIACQSCTCARWERAQSLAVGAESWVEKHPDCPRCAALRYQQDAPLPSANWMYPDTWNGAEHGGFCCWCPSVPRLLFAGS